MAKTLALNRSPYHEQCRAHLVILGETAAPGVLYGLQLAAWGLENLSLSGELALDTDDLDGMIRQLLRLPEEEGHRFLLGADEDDDLEALAAEKLALLQAAEDPEQAATWLAEDVYHRLARFVNDEAADN